MRNVSDKSFRGKSKHTFCVQQFFFLFENRAIYEIMWKNIVERGRPQMAIWRMRVACWIPKATNTHTHTHTNTNTHTNTHTYTHTNTHTYTYRVGCNLLQVAILLKFGVTIRNSTASQILNIRLAGILKISFVLLA